MNACLRAIRKQINFRNPGTFDNRFLYAQLCYFRFMNPTTVMPALQDPPVPRRANTIIKMSPEAALKNTIAVIIMALCLIVPAFFLLKSAHYGWGGVLGLLGAALFFTALFSPKTLVAPCPFCDSPINGILNGSKVQEVRCKECYEYSVVQGGKVKPMDPAISNDRPRFLAPVFEDAVWPAGCVACGAPPTRRESLEDRSVNALGLAIGRVFVTKASLANVPYCDVHKNSVQLNVGQDKKMDLKWCSLRMMRHYLALNKGKKSMGTKAAWNA